MEKKKEDDDDKEEMQVKWRDEEDMEDSLLAEEGMMVEFPLVPFVISHSATASRFFPPRNH